MTRTRARRRRFRPLRLVVLIFALFVAAPFILTVVFAAWYFTLGHAAVILTLAALAVAGYTIVRVTISTLRSIDTVRSLM